MLEKLSHTSHLNNIFEERIAFGFFSQMCGGNKSLLLFFLRIAVFV